MTRPWPSRTVSDRTLVDRIAAAHGLPELLAQVLVARQLVRDDAEAEAFLNPKLADLVTPGGLHGLEAAVTERLNARFDVQMVADVEASAFAPADNKVGDYTLANLGLSYRVSDVAEAYLRVENLFDEDYEISGGFNTPGQAVYVGIRAAF